MLIRRAPKSTLRFASQILGDGLKPFASLHEEEKTSLNRDVAWLRPNLKFHFLPTRDTREKPASFGQIVENFVFRENFFYPTDEKTHEIKISHNKG